MIALTSKEKNLLMLPAALALAILVLLAYSFHLASEQRDVKQVIDRLGAGIAADQQSLREVESLAANEQRLRHHQIDVWLPVFNNILEVRLYASRKAQQALTSVGAVHEDWSLSEIPSDARPRVAELQMTAIFPSYAALTEFLKQVEDTPPPLLPQQVELIKTGMTIDASFTFYFGYRLSDETI